MLSQIEKKIARHIKCLKNSHFWIYCWIYLVACSALSRKPSYIRNELFMPFIVYMQYHQSQHLNSVLDGGLYPAPSVWQHRQQYQRVQELVLHTFLWVCDMVWAPWKTSGQFLIKSSNSLSASSLLHLSLREIKTGTQKDLFKDGRSNLIPNSPSMQTTQLSINSIMHKQIVAHSWNWMLIKSIPQLPVWISKYYVESKKPDTQEHIWYKSIHLKTENRQCRNQK